jgi:hypothetical protein
MLRTRIQDGVSWPVRADCGHRRLVVTKPMTAPTCPGRARVGTAVVAAASGGDFTASVAFHNASAGSVHAIVDIFGYFV